MSMSEVSSLLYQLEEHYLAYAARERTARESNSFSKLFRHWFFYHAEKCAPEDMLFLDTTSNLVEALKEHLDSLPQKDRKTGSSAACSAVALMLHSPPGRISQERALYLAAAQSRCVPLLSYLTQEQLRHQYEDYVRTTPRSQRLPNQEELVREMARLLKKGLAKA